MKRIGNSIFNLLSAISLLACICTIVLSFEAIAIDLGSPGMGSKDTIVNVTRFRYEFAPLDIALALLPLKWVYERTKGFRANRQIHAGLCQTCGYDLRATPDRRPECGTIAGTNKQEIVR